MGEFIQSTMGEYKAFIFAVISESAVSSDFLIFPQKMFVLGVNLEVN